jgi:hypothetical protein
MTQRLQIPFCTKEDNQINTHRTEFLGKNTRRKCYNVLVSYGSKNVPTDEERVILYNVGELAGYLIASQRHSFTLNEYPENCTHRCYIDFDHCMNGKILQAMLDCIQGLRDVTNDDKLMEIKVLRNNVSGKIHLILDTPSSSSRKNNVKQKLLNFLSNYIFSSLSKDFPDFKSYYTHETWQKYFDENALGLRSALSVKIKNGKIEPGIYVPVDEKYQCIDVRGWYGSNKQINCIKEYSIYAAVKTQWAGFVQEFIEVEKTIPKVVKKEYKIFDEYNADKKTIKFLGEEYTVSEDLINDFIDNLPKNFVDGYMWKIVLRYVKGASELVKDFDNSYFLYEWSKGTKGKFDKSGNDAVWDYEKPNNKPGECLTWLRNQAIFTMTNGENSETEL